MNRRTVTEVLDDARTLLQSIGVIEVEGTLAGVNRTRTGGILGELVAYRGVGQLEARLPFVMFGQGNAAERFVTGTAAILSGVIEITNTHAPLRLNVQRVITVGAADRNGAAGREEIYAAMVADGTAVRNKQHRVEQNLGVVGVVAPAGGGAGRADFLSRLTDARRGIEVIEERAPMSGPTAAALIATAITRLGHTQLIVITRGGGPASELATFDHPHIAAAIARSPVPVLVAVGHSTDQTLADRVAAFSVATPTAAAAWIIDHSTATERLAASNALAQAQQQLQARETSLVTTTHEHDLRMADEQARLRTTKRVLLALAIVMLLAAIVIGTQ